MSAERVTAFGDGVIAIVITIMVLSLRQPHGAGFGALRAATHRCSPTR
ncbi:MAG: TMEM175 family protein [Acidimicrobiales bacterium]